MTDSVNIDNMSREQMLGLADDMGIRVSGNAKDDTIRAKLKEQLGEAPAPDIAESSAAAAPGESKKSKRFDITVHTDKDDKQPVQVGVNGRTYVITRGKKVTVPESVIEVLNNAVQVQYDPETMEQHEIQSYPFTNHGEV